MNTWPNRGACGGPQAKLITATGCSQNNDDE